MTTTQNRIHTLETRSSKYISKILLFPRTLENLIVLEKFGTTTCEVNKMCHYFTSSQSSTMQQIRADRTAKSSYVKTASILQSACFLASMIAKQFNFSFPSEGNHYCTVLYSDGIVQPLPIQPFNIDSKITQKRGNISVLNIAVTSFLLD